MERKAISYLQQWLASKQRKPIIIRGARQVGKTWLVRRLAELSNKKLIELNFESNPEFFSLFVNHVKEGDPEFPYIMGFPIYSRSVTSLSLTSDNIALFSKIFNFFQLFTIENTLTP